jgi:hypothetical protein
MLGLTLFGIFLTPMFCYVIPWFKDLRPEVEVVSHLEAAPDVD